MPIEGQVKFFTQQNSAGVSWEIGDLHTGHRWTKQSAGCSIKRSWEESKTARQGWVGENQSSSGPKPQKSRERLWSWRRSLWWNRSATSRQCSKASREHGPGGRTPIITWADIWETPQARLSFLVRAAYDTVPCPRNLSQGFGGGDKCPLSSKDNTGLQHIP